MSLADRKKARKNRTASLRNKVAADKSKSYTDPRMWRCQRDKSGLGAATFRFLEPTEADMKWFVEEMGYEEDQVPFYIGYHKHNFKGQNGKWMIEKCPTSIMETDCPVCEANGQVIEATGKSFKEIDDSDPAKKLVRTRKRKEIYVANILIIQDKANPENEGQVKLFEYGKSIHDMAMAQLIPEFEDEESCDVSDYWEGRDFKLKIVQKDGYANYDKSSWGDIKAVAKTDEAIEEILNKQFTLNTIVAKSEYKSYDDLVKQFDKTKALGEPKRKTVSDAGDDSGDDKGDAGGQDEPKEPVKSLAKKSKPATKPSDKSDDDKYFESLLNEA